MCLFSLFAASLCGVGTHLGYFIHGEHHVQAPKIVQAHLVAFLALLISIYRSFNREPLPALKETTALSSFYLAGLFSSIVCYRLFFHRTRHFPGPTLAGLTKFYHLFNARTARQHIWLDELHKQYGDYVRTGPNEITVFSPKAIPLIHGTNLDCPKAAWYDNLIPCRSLVTSRSRAEHSKRRIVMDQAFSIRHLQTHEPTILQYAELLAQRLGEREGQAIDITTWLDYYSFDLMGMLHYSKPFDLLKRAQGHYVVDLHKKGIEILGHLSGAPWVLHLARSIPFLTAGMRQHSAWAKASITFRAENEPEKPDSLGWLIAGAPKGSDLETELLGDFLTIVTGGTDPVTSTLVFMLYHLAQHPEHLEKIRSEIRQLTSYSSSVQLQDLPHLNAVIFESMRVDPPLPSGGLRTTPSDGLTIGETYIPGNVTVLTPHHTLHRREDCFVRAKEFIPERWTTSPELILDRNAFFPWGAGPYACAGKNLGLMEIRIAAAVLLDRFDFKFAPGEDGTNLRKKALDCFALLPGEMRMVFKERVPEVNLSYGRVSL